ncbi:peptidoglycan editing factor PgeF [Qiania dongpingensis]|nr:peptidoglycan editing factor PgeF [Qiania dongpingensis]
MMCGTSSEQTILWNRKAGEKEQEIQCRIRKGIPFLSFPLLEESGLVKHGFSTRLGGVSEGVCASMNLGFHRGEARQKVMENYRRMAEALEMPMERMVLSQQTHTTNVRVVTEADAGNGIIRPLPYSDVDGLITNVRGLPLVTFYADCVPLYFVDPVNRAIGLSHSGWRGTKDRMGRHTLERMREAFGSRPEEVLACVGPSICRSCYEVSLDVAEEFRRAFGELADERLLDEKPDGKFQLDLWEANRLILLDSGILPEHLAVTDICTCCNPEFLFSHRASGGRRGNLAAFLCLE